MEEASKQYFLLYKAHADRPIGIGICRRDSHEMDLRLFDESKMVLSGDYLFIDQKLTREIPPRHARIIAGIHGISFNRPAMWKSTPISQ